MTRGVKNKAEVRKLRYGEIRGYRSRLHRDNNRKCPLCEEVLQETDAALDHCHKTGHVRNTVHKDCNILLGKIENYIFRYGKRFREGKALEKFMKNVVKYMEMDYSENHLHPTHKTPEDKQLKEWKKRMKRAKRHETKEKYKKLIQEFNNARNNT